MNELNIKRTLYKEAIQSYCEKAQDFLIAQKIPDTVVLKGILAEVIKKQCIQKGFIFKE